MSPLLATRRAALATRTDAGEQIPVVGSWRAAVRQAVRSRWWRDVEAKSLVVQQLSLTEPEVRSIRGWVNEIKDGWHRLRAFRWLVRVFLPGRHTFAGEHYGEEIPWPQCGCVEAVHRGQLFHYVSCRHTEQRRQALTLTICREQDDRSLDLRLRRMCAESTNTPRICLGLNSLLPAQRVPFRFPLPHTVIEFVSRLMLEN
jgi:hypothetical protein